MGSVYGKMLRSGKLNLLDIDGTELKIYKPADLTAEQRAHLQSVGDWNSTRTYRNKDYVDEVSTSLKNALAPENTTSRLHILTFKGEVVAFCVVTDLEEDGLNKAHIGSVNVPPEGNGFGIGRPFLKEVLAKVAEDRIAHLLIWEGNPAKTLYEELGFHQNGNAWRDVRGTGMDAVYMERSPLPFNPRDVEEDLPAN